MTPRPPQTRDPSSAPGPHDITLRTDNRYVTRIRRWANSGSYTLAICVHDLNSCTSYMLAPDIHNQYTQTFPTTWRGCSYLHFNFCTVTKNVEIRKENVFVACPMPSQSAPSSSKPCLAPLFVGHIEVWSIDV